MSEFVEKPVELLQEVIRTMDAGCRSAIALVFMHGGMLASPVMLSAEEDRALALMGTAPAEVRRGLWAYSRQSADPGGASGKRLVAV